MSIFIEILSSWTRIMENIIQGINGNQVAAKKKEEERKITPKKKKKSHYESMIIWMYAAIHRATVAECDKYLINY